MAPTSCALFFGSGVLFRVFVILGTVYDEGSAPKSFAANVVIFAGWPKNLWRFLVGPREYIWFWMVAWCLEQADSKSGKWQCLETRHGVDFISEDRYPQAKPLYM